MGRRVFPAAVLALAGLFLLAGLLSGCADRAETGGQNERGMRVTEALGSELSDVDRIEVQFGDGNRLTVTDDAAIRAIVAPLRNIRVRPSGRKLPESVGFLFVLHLHEQGQIRRVSDDLTLPDARFEPADESSDDQAREWRRLVLQWGRESIPDLLRGVPAEAG